MQFMKKVCLVLSVCFFSHANACELVKETTLKAFQEIMQIIQENPEEQIRKKMPPVIEKYVDVQRLVNILKRKGFTAAEEPALKKLIISKLPDVLTFSAKSYADSVFDIKETKPGEKICTIIGVLKTKDGKLIKVTIKASKEKSKITDIVIENISWVKLTIDKINDDISKQGTKTFKKNMMEQFGK